MEKSSDKYSDQEAQRRFHEALRGARDAGHKTMKDILKKNGESRGAKRKKPKGTHSQA
jgi:hypothetical protein